MCWIEASVGRSGMGNQFSIWKNKWLPSPTTFRVVTPLNTLVKDVWVSELIDYEKKEWKKDLVESIFMPHEAIAICHLPLSHRLPEDQFMWHYHPKGVFTIRSAYMMVLDSTHRSYGNLTGETSNHDRECAINIFIWNKPLPNKIKYFLWRAYRGILLTRASLVRRKVPVDRLCPTYG
ncbi:hypothetical protein L1049_011844 [Liquidambar formosana]|uniref:Reverse transcriptase zinc-binding domain-containing protein n=1 Tax=Liquidambar formosana TaxID=63359 RepID=A0AAP0RYY6_LIQFO